MNNIVVLSTTVESILAVTSLAPELDRLAGRGNWNFDLQDTDHVLRIVAARRPEPFIALLHRHGYAAADLPDQVPDRTFQSATQQAS